MIQMVIGCAAKKIKLNCSVFGMITIAKAGIVPFKDEVPASQPQRAAVHKNCLISIFFVAKCLRNVFVKLNSAFVEM